MSKAITTVLMKAWKGGFSTKSDFARAHADQVAIAASCGLITTKMPGGQLYGREWLITKQGLEVLNECN